MDSQNFVLLAWDSSRSSGDEQHIAFKSGDLNERVGGMEHKAPLERTLTLTADS